VRFADMRRNYHTVAAGVRLVTARTRRLLRRHADPVQPRTGNLDLCQP